MTIVRHTRPTPALRHKYCFAYECQYTCMDMPCHAVHAWAVIVLPHAPCNKRQVCPQGLESSKQPVVTLYKLEHALKRLRPACSLS